IFSRAILVTKPTQATPSQRRRIMKDSKQISKILLITAIVCICGLPLAIMSQSPNGDRDDRNFDAVIQKSSRELMAQGKQTFRFDTFGDEAFWGDSLKLHQAIAGAKLGGVGSGVSPRTALAVGLKVDSEALPAEIAQSIREGRVDLNDPATTLALLR